MASQKLFDQSFFHFLAGLSMSGRIRPDSGFSGQYKSGRKGTSIEFSDIREYLPGDDIRRIDWNAYARTEKLFVKLYMDERDIHYHILIDMSRSMDIPKEKSEKACRIAGMLAWLALNSGDRVDITFLQEQNPYTTKTFSGTASFYRLLSELEKAEFSGTCDMFGNLRSLPFHGSGTVFLISDFLQPWEEPTHDGHSYHNYPEIRDILSLLQSKKQTAVLIHLVSMVEEHPELLFEETGTESLFLLTDSETGGKMKITPSKTLLKQYAAIKTEWESLLSSTAARYGTPYLKTISEEPLEKLLRSGLQKGLWK